MDNVIQLKGKRDEARTKQIRKEALDDAVENFRNGLSDIVKAWNDGELIVENIEGLEDLSGSRITLLHRDHPDMPVTLTFQV